jgi:hypothetical protein
MTNVVRLERRRSDVITCQPWRSKQKVLCLFEAVLRCGNSTRTVRDSVMISVEFSDQIEPAFDEAVREMIARPNGPWPGAKPLTWALKRYIPEGGKETF